MAAHQVLSVPPGTQNECPLYGACPCRFEMLLTHRPPALCRKCHFGDTRLCRSVSSQGNESSKQRNARALSSQAQSCSLLSHSQAAAIPDIPRLPTSMQRRFAIKSTGLRPLPVIFLVATADQGSASFLEDTSQGSWASPFRIFASACHGWLWF